MARYRRRRRRRSGRRFLVFFVILAVGATVWWRVIRDDGSAPENAPIALGPPPRLTTDRPETGPVESLPSDVPELGQAPPPVVPGGGGGPAEPPAALVAAGKQALERGDAIAARTYLSDALRRGLAEPELALVRAELTRLGYETILSGRILDNDPLVSRHVVQPGETLGKIAARNKVSPELLAQINGIHDKNLIRAGQTMKIVTGPFRAVVDKRSYMMDVYIQNTFVKQFRVGLGADDSTPSGEWKVGTKLLNPTYYPPRGGAIVAADDPENPLAEHWIGLVGIGGEALGQQRYGIHGTIDPDSIGKSVSLGCIRMYNEDVAALYGFLVEGHSTVTVLE